MTGRMPTMSTNITLTQLRALVAVTDDGGFSAAAERLGVSQSTLSQSIGTLEAALGVSLLARGRNGVAPTAAGQAIESAARRALAAVDRISASAAEARGVTPGAIRLAAVRSAARRLLPPAIAAFRASDPQVEVSLYEGSDLEVGDLVRSGAVDLGLAALSREGLVSEPLMADSFVLVARRGHRLLGRGPVPLGSLDGEPFVMSTDGCEPLIRALLAEEQVVPNVAIRVGDMATLLGMVREGIGVSILPTLALPAGGPPIFAPPRSGAIVSGRCTCWKASTARARARSSRCWPCCRRRPGGPNGRRWPRSARGSRQRPTAPARGRRRRGGRRR